MPVIVNLNVEPEKPERLKPKKTKKVKAPKVKGARDTNVPSKKKVLPKAPKKAKNGNGKPKAPRKSKPKPKLVIERLSFAAQIKQTNQSNNALTSDNNYYVKLATRDSRIMDLGKLPPSTLVKVTIAAIVEDGKIKQEDEKIYQ
jgi:hypothetical protein